MKLQCPSILGPPPYFNSALRRNPPYTPEPCLTPNQNRGPTVLTLQGSHTISTLWRKPTFPGFSSARSSTVRERRSRLWPHLSVLTSFVRFILGILIVLFFKCMAALLNPTNRRRWGIKWGLVSYVAAMFSFVTVLTAMDVNNLSDSYIDNREFPGVDGVLLPGPPGYQTLIDYKAPTVIPNLMFLLNNWMADGLLVSLSDAPFTRSGI